MITIKRSTPTYKGSSKFKSRADQVWLIALREVARVLGKRLIKVRRGPKKNPYFDVYICDWGNYERTENN